MKRNSTPRRAGRPVGTDNDTGLLIVKTASALLGKTGIEGLSNRLICEKSGITPPTLYHHFPDKNALLDALVGQAFTEFLEDKRANVNSSDPLIRYKENWHNFARFAKAHPEHFKIMASAIAVGRMPSLGSKPYSYPTSDLEAIDRKYGLRVSVAVAAQLSMSMAFGSCVLPLSTSDIKWESSLSDTALEAILHFILK